MGVVLLPDSAPMDAVAAALEAPVERYETALDAFDALATGTVGCVVVDAAMSDAESVVGRYRRRTPSVGVGVAVDPESSGAGVGLDADRVLDRTDAVAMADWVREALEEHAFERGERLVSAATRRVRAAERAVAGGPDGEMDPGSSTGDDAAALGSREAVEREVVGALGGTDPYPVAWVGRHDPVAGQLQPTVAVGVPVAHLRPVRAPASGRWDTPGETATDPAGGDGSRSAGDGRDVAPASEGVVTARVLSEDRVAVDPVPGTADRLLIGIRLPATPAGVLYLVADRSAGVPEGERRALRRLAGRVGDAISVADDEGAGPPEEERRLQLLADTFAHELNNHLGAASTQLGLAADRGDEEHFEHVSRALARLEELGAETRALARAEPPTESVDLERSAVDAWEYLSTPGARLETESGTVQAAPPLLRLALINLFRNAVQHGAGESHGSGDEGELVVRVGPRGEGLYVADDGPGIPPDRREEVFEWGHSGDEGEGVGLALVSLVADRHGWTASVEESESGGARFVLGPAT